MSLAPLIFVLRVISDCISRSLRAFLVPWSWEWKLGRQSRMTFTIHHAV